MNVILTGKISLLRFVYGLVQVLAVAASLRLMRTCEGLKVDVWADGHSYHLWSILAVNHEPEIRFAEKIPNIPCIA